MKKNVLILLALTLVLTLCACVGDGDVPTETQNVESAGETEASTLEDMQTLPPQPGYYLVSSVGQDGDISFYGSLDPANGYLKLEEDHTGMMCFNEVEQALTWDQESVTWGEEILPCMYVTYYEPELEGSDSMLVLYFLDSMTSVIFRPAEEPVSD